MKKLIIFWILLIAIQICFNFGINDINAQVSTPFNNGVGTMYIGWNAAQNVPNPFADHTSIKYFIPENAGYAQIIFTDNFGKIIKTVDLSGSGEGTLNVFADNLRSGVYTYSLVIDGKVIESKQMVCTK